MQFGIFDQNDHGPYPLSEQYENRLQLIEFYDRAGFRTYHMSEHHSTPLNLTPSPSVFLAAVAQRTKRLRLRRAGLRAAGASSAAARRRNLHAGSSEPGPDRGRHRPRCVAARTALFRRRSGPGAGDVCRGLYRHHAGADANRGEFSRQALSLRERADRNEAGAASASAAVVRGSCAGGRGLAGAEQDQYRLWRAIAARARDYRPLSRGMGRGGKFAGSTALALGSTASWSRPIPTGKRWSSAAAPGRTSTRAS